MRPSISIILALLLFLVSVLGSLVENGTEGSLAFEDDILMNTDGTNTAQGKPDIAASGNDLYIVWQDQRNGNWDIFLKASHDGGLTFGSEVRVDDTSITQTLSDDNTDQKDPEVAIDSFGKVYVIWSDDREGRPLIYMARSIDNGASFSANYAVSFDLLGTQTNPHFDISPSDRMMVVWEDDRNSIGHEQVYGAHSADGSTFSTAVRISDTSFDNYCYTPRIAFTDDENIHVVWTEDRILDMDIRIASSTDGGGTFSSSYIVNRDPTSSDQEMADIDANSTTVVMVWKDARMSSADIYMTISLDNALSFPMEFVAHPGRTSGHQYEPVVAIESTGNISIGWTSSPGITDTKRSDILMTRLLTNGTFDEVETVNDPGSEITQDSPSLAVSKGIVHLAWRDYRKNTQADIFYSRTTVSGEEGEAPVLSDAIVDPVLSGPDTKFTFKVVYSDVENDEPLPGYPKLNLTYKVGDRFISYPGSPFNMTLRMIPRPDWDYTNGETYLTTITPGKELELYYQFIARASSGNQTLVTTDPVKGPLLDWIGPTFDNFSPSTDEWQGDNIVSFSADITDDLSGVDPWSIYYQRFNLATGTWDKWQRKGTIEPIDNLTVHYSVNITLFDGEENQVRFRARDILGNGDGENFYSISEIVRTRVDPTGPFFRIDSPRSGEVLYDPTIDIEAAIWDLGSGLDTTSINISHSIGDQDNYGEWVPIETLGGTLTPDEDEEGMFHLKVKLSLTYGYNNFFRLRGNDLIGNERISSEVQVVIKDKEDEVVDRPPEPIQSIQPKVSGSVRPHITWTPTYDPDGDLVYYWIRLTGISDDEEIIGWTPVGAGTTYWDPSDDISLDPGSSYLIEVMPHANGLNGTVTNSTLLISTDANFPPTPPTGMEPRATSDPMPTLRWKSSTDPEGGEVFYFIRIGSFYGGGNIQDWTSTFTEPKYQVKKILGAGIYHVQLMCSDGSDFSTISHFTLSIGIYAPLVESERTSIVIFLPEDVNPDIKDTKSDKVELTVFNKGFTFDNIRLRLSGEATQRDDMDIYTEDDILEISAGSYMNTTLVISLYEDTALGFYSLNVTVTSLDGISSYTKALTVRIVKEGSQTGLPDSSGQDQGRDTEVLLWLFFALLIVILAAMFYAYYKIDKKQREQEVDVIPTRKGRIKEIKGARKEELKGEDKGKPKLPPTRTVSDENDT